MAWRRDETASQYALRIVLAVFGIVASAYLGYAISPPLGLWGGILSIVAVIIIVTVDISKKVRR